MFIIMVRFQENSLEEAHADHLHYMTFILVNKLVYLSLETVGMRCTIIIYICGGHMYCVHTLWLRPAASPSSCCIWHKSCDGFLSPSSSTVKSCWRRRCSEAAVRWISCALRTLYGSSSSGARRRSRTLVANSGASAATT